MREIKTSLRDNTLKMLKNRPASLTFTQISRDTGISVGWLKAFSCGQVDNPGVNTVETLGQYLSTKSNA